MISFKSTRKKIALFFSLLCGGVIMFTVFGVVYIATLQFDSHAKNVLSESLNVLEVEYEQDLLDEKGIDYQSSNILNDRLSNLKELPNIKDKEVVSKNEKLNEEVEEEVINYDKLKENKAVYSRVVLPNEDILFSSDLFDSFNVDPNADGFQKHTYLDLCIYSYTSKISSGKNIGHIIQVAQYCPVSPNQVRVLYLSAVFMIVFVIIFTYFLGLIIGKYFMKPIEKSVEQARQFTRNCYHELLTPLTVALSTVEASSKTEDYKNGLLSVEKDLVDASKSLKLLSNNALQNQVDISFQEVDLSELLLEVLEVCRENIGRSDVVFEVNVESKIKKYVNKTSVKIIFQNLIENAIKYSKQGGRILLELDQDKLIIENSIQEGVKIDAKKAFSRSFRGENSAGINGKGLGLAIVKELCDVHGWRVKVVSGGGRFGVEVVGDFVGS